MRNLRKILLILIFILLINILTISDIKNIEYKDNNIEINYPIFNNKIIDNYIDNYINNSYDDNIFLDYDYYVNKNIVNINFYNYRRKNKIVNYNIDSFKIDLSTSKIEEGNSFIMNNYNYLEQDNISKNDKIIAFTFDDGPNYNTSKMIDILNKYNVKATFFVVGEEVEKHPEIIKKMFENGMEIGNHTYDHKLLTKLNINKIEDEINKTNNIIYNVIGKYPKLLRTSYGSVNKKIKNNINMPIILWSIDTLDWKYHNSNKIANKILKNAKDGSIILLHDIYSSSVNAIDIVIPKLLKQGYKIVTITELAYYKNITLQPNKIYGYFK